MSSSSSSLTFVTGFSGVAFSEHVHSYEWEIMSRELADHCQLSITRISHAETWFALDTQAISRTIGMMGVSYCLPVISCIICQ